MGVAVFSVSTPRRTFSRVAFIKRSPDALLTASTDGLSASTSAGRWPGSV